MVPMKCDESQVHLVQELLHGPIVKFPIKYLGLQLLVGKILKAKLYALVDQMADRLPS
jgi:hypothetical protein